MLIKIQMSSIMGQIEPEHPELFALEFTNINQSAPNLVNMFMTITSWMSLIMELIIPELSKLSALEFENFSYLTSFTL